MSQSLLTIVDAMDSPALFQPWFSGRSWDGWRSVLKGAYGLPMTEAESACFYSVAARDPPKQKVRELWVVAGRRAGKDSIASLIAAHSAALFEHGDRLRPGERAVIMCLACDRPQAALVKNYTRAYFDRIPSLRGMIQRETADGFELNNNVDVTVATNNYRSVRGRAIAVSIFDECAFWRDETSATPDEEVYKAISPALASIPGSILIGISSGYRKSGLLYRKHKQNYGKDGDILVVKATTRQLNPTIDQAIIDRALDEDPAAARSEWLGEFREDIAGWADIELIEAARDHGVTVRPPLVDRRFIYRSGVDPSGGARDSYTCAIAHDEDGVAILDCLVEIRPPFNPTTATEQIAATLKEYGLHNTVGDKYAAQWVIDAFAKCGIRYTHSERDRSQIYLDCLPLFTSGRVRLLDNQRLITQFASLERRTSSLGKDRVDQGASGHDDLCNAAALALITQRKSLMNITDDMIEQAGIMPAYMRAKKPWLHY